MTILKPQIWRSVFSQNTLLSDSRGVPMICILFLDFARFVIIGLKNSRHLVIQSEILTKSNRDSLARVLFQRFVFSFAYLLGVSIGSVNSLCVLCDWPV